MTAHEERRTIPGFSRRNVLRAGLLAGAGLATAGATSAALTGTAKAASVQTTWAWCQYCQGMWYAGYFYSQPSQLNGNGNLGFCPANGDGGHLLANDSSFDYQLGYNFGTAGSQPQGGWLWCGACMGLYTSLHTPSVCPAGGSHYNGGGRSTSMARAPTITFITINRSQQTRKRTGAGAVFARDCTSKGIIRRKQMGFAHFMG